MAELIITTVPQPAGNIEYKFGEVDTNLLLLDGNIITVSASLAERIDNLPTGSSGSGTPTPTGSLIKTASANPSTSDITFTKGDDTTFTITTANDKANLSGGNTFSGDQIIDGSGKLKVYTKVETPVIQGFTGDKTNISYGTTQPVFTAPSGAYTALIMDTYVVGDNYPEYYATLRVTALPNSGDIAATVPYIFTMMSDITSPSASAETTTTTVDGIPYSTVTTPATFTTSSLILSSDYNGSNARVLVENLSQTKDFQNLNIIYRTIIRAFPTS